MHVRSEEKLRNQTIIYLGKLQYPIWELVLTQDVPFQLKSPYYKSIIFKLFPRQMKTGRWLADLAGWPIRGLVFQKQYWHTKSFYNIVQFGTEIYYLALIFFSQWAWSWIWRVLIAAEVGPANLSYYNMMESSMVKKTPSNFFRKSWFNFT